MESNGSTSMASVCAGTMSLLAAGVPLKRPVAGISVGLVTACLLYTSRCVYAPGEIRTGAINTVPPGGFILKESTHEGLSLIHI